MNSLSEKGPKAGKAQGIVLLMAAAMPIMAIASLVPVLPLLMREFADVPGSQALVPIAITVPALCVALFAPLAGWMSDKAGRKRLLVATLFLYGLTGIMPWFLTDLYAIIATRVGLGIMEAAIMTISTALIADYYEGEERERWISFQVAIGSVAAIVLVAAGGMLGDIFGSRGPFLLYILGFVVALIAALVLFEPDTKAQQERAADISTKVLPQIWPLVLITFGAGLLFYVLVVQIGPILEVDGKLDPSQVGMAAAILNGGIMLGSILFKASKRRPGSGPLAFGLALCAVGFLGAGLVSGFVMVTAFGMLIALGAGFILPNMLNWTLSKLAPAVRGRGTGVWTGSFFLAQFVSPLAFGALAGMVGGIKSALIVIAISAGIGVLGALVFALRSGASAAPSGSAE